MPYCLFTCCVQGSNSNDSAIGLEEAMANLSLPTDIPPPHAPPIRKRDLYTDTSVFDEPDRDVIRVSDDSVSSVVSHFVTMYNY